MSDELVLLGAGASIEAGFEDSVGLLNRLMFELKQDFESPAKPIVVGGRTTGSNYELADWVYKRLTRHGQEKLGPEYRPNIEEYFAALEALGGFDDEKIAPFVDEIPSCLKRWLSEKSNWRHMPIWSTNHPKSHPSSELRGFKFSLLSAMTHYFSARTPADFRKARYLSPLLEHVQKHGTPVTTLNYDLALERRAEAIKLEFCRGVLTGQRPHLLSWDDGKPDLIKLHGSADWFFNYQNIEVSEEPPMGPPFTPAIIFGAGNKLTAYGPYLGLLNRFKQRLSTSKRLSIIGYSFGDDHVNEAIFQSLGSGIGSIRIANGPSFDASDLPRRIFAGNIERPFEKICTIENLRASEAIKKWYG